MKRMLSLLLVSVFLLTALVSCAKGNGDETTLAPTEAGETTLGTDDVGQQLFNSALPTPGTLNFEGLELLIYSPAGDTRMREWYKEEYTSDILDLAIQNRNDLVQSELNLKWTLEFAASNSDWDAWVASIQDTVQQDIQVGHYYDMYCMQMTSASFTGFRGAQANMLDEDIFKYFDFSLPCWNESVVNTQVNNKLLYVVGDNNLTVYDQTLLVWHNKTLYDRVKTDSDPADLQDIALAGKWDYEDFYRWSSLVEDAGTGKACDNTYGIGDIFSDAYNAFLPAFDQQLIKTNSDGTHSFNISNNMALEGALADVRDLRAQKGVNNCGASVHTWCEYGRSGHFANGQALFLIFYLYSSEAENLAIREMEDKYCILPMPKYYEDQASYGTTIGGNANLVSVLNHPEDVIKGDAISAFYQRITELSYTPVRGAYIEKIIKPRFFGNDDDDGTVSKSIETFDIILDSIKIGFDEIHGGGILNINWLWMDGIENSKQMTLTDAFERNDYSGGGVLRTKEMYEQALKDFDNFMFDIE